jgi:hypothetical protein
MEKETSKRGQWRQAYCCDESVALFQSALTCYYDKYMISLSLKNGKMRGSSVVMMNKAWNNHAFIAVNAKIVHPRIRSEWLFIRHRPPSVCRDCASGPRLCRSDDALSLTIGPCVCYFFTTAVQS